MRLTSCRFAARSLIPSLPVATHLTVQPAAARQGEQLFCAPQRPETPQFPQKHVCTATSPPSPSSVRRATLRFGVGSLAAVPLAQVLVFTMHESSRTGAQRRPWSSGYGVVLSNAIVYPTYGHCAPTLQKRLQFAQAPGPATALRELATALRQHEELATPARARGPGPQAGAQARPRAPGPEPEGCRPGRWL